MHILRMAIVVLRPPCQLCLDPACCRRKMDFRSNRRRSVGSHLRNYVNTLPIPPRSTSRQGSLAPEMNQMRSLRRPSKTGTCWPGRLEFSLKLYESESTLAAKINENPEGAGKGRCRVNSILWGCLALWGAINCIIAVCLVRRASQSAGVRPVPPNVLSQDSRHPADGIAV